MLKNFVSIFVIGLIVGIIIGLIVAPTTNPVINKAAKKEYQTVAVDTLIEYQTVEIEKIVYKNLEPIKEIDTVYIQNYDSSYVNDLLAEYECARKKLIENGFERIKYFNKVTDAGDTLYLELESVKDAIIKAEIMLAAREVVSTSYNTYLQPKEPEKEAWYIKPAIAVSCFGLGYLTNGIVK